MTSEAAKKAWETRKKRYGQSGKTRTKKAKPRAKSKSKTAAQKAAATKSKGRRIKGTYAPPKKWWAYMTEQPHGKSGKPLSPAAAGHLWFKVYDDKRRLEVIKQYG